MYCNEWSNIDNLSVLEISASYRENPFNTSKGATGDSPGSVNTSGLSAFSAFSPQVLDKSSMKKKGRANRSEKGDVDTTLSPVFSSPILNLEAHASNANTASFLDGNYQIHKVRLILSILGTALLKSLMISHLLICQL